MRAYRVYLQPYIIIKNYFDSWFKFEWFIIYTSRFKLSSIGWVVERLKPFENIKITLRCFVLMILIESLCSAEFLPVWIELWYYHWLLQAMVLILILFWFWFYVFTVCKFIALHYYLLSLPDLSNWCLKCFCLRRTECSPKLSLVSNFFLYCLFNHASHWEIKLYLFGLDNLWFLA